MSVQIQNFFLGVDEYTVASGIVSVDLVDFANNIVTASGTYFIIDGAVTSGTFSPIVVGGAVDAYKMSYDPADDFASLMGPTEFKVHATNDAWEVSERDYHLTYGYKISFDNLAHKYIDFGYQNRIVVRARAENLASCPKESAEANWFETRSLFFKDLTCSIVGTPYDNKDLSAYINAITTAYYYGRVCRLVVNAKDFAGNEMEPFILIYTIEDET